MSDLGENERQLTRQRGTETRDASNTGFELNPGKRQSRKERQLMRQRGAGNRNIENIDFGFSFPTPVQSRRSSTRLSKSSRRSASVASTRSAGRHALSTPARPARESVEGVAESIPPTAQSLREYHTVSSVERGSGKRRRLNDSSEAPAQTRPLRNRRSSAAVFTIAEEVDAGTENDQPNHVRTLEDDSVLSLAPNTTGEDEKENRPHDLSTTKISQKRKKRKSIVLRKSSKNKRASNGSSNGSSTDTVDGSMLESQHIDDSSLFIPESAYRADLGSQLDTDAVVGEAVPKLHGDDAPDTPLAAGIDHFLVGAPTAVANVEVTLESRVPEVQRMTRRRIRASLESQIQASGMSGQDTRSALEGDAHAHAQPAVLASSPVVPKSKSHALLGPRRLNNHGRRSRLSISVSPEPVRTDDVEEDETYMEDEQSPEPTTPAPPSRPGRKRKRKGIESKTDGAQHKRKSADTSFPILTHRMTNVEFLPIITEEAEDGASCDEAAPLPPTFRDRTAPNAVDVLAQICREIIDGAVAKLDSHAGTSRAGIKKQKEALSEFGHDLDVRLFDMSEAVEHRLTLEARLRKSKREKAEVQARWMEVRREREKIGLEADAIRREHWESEEQSKRDWSISDLAHRTELALDSGRPESDDLKFMMRSTAATVSSASHEGGLLDKVRSFNAQLERIALALEAR